MSTLDEYKSRKIRIFKNGDRFSSGRKIVVSPKIYRNFEQFLHNISGELNLNNGAVRKVYSVKGNPIKSVEELKDGGFYVATAGEAYKKIEYRLKEDNTKTPYVVKRHSKLEYLRDDTAVDENQIFNAESKAFRVVVFMNGELSTPPIKMVLNYRNCKSFDQLIMNISNEFERKIRKLYDAHTAARIKSLLQLKDGQNLVGCNLDTFKKLNYPLQNPLLLHELKKDDEKAKVVTFYPNGDAYHHGFTLTVTKFKYYSIRKLIEMLNQTLDLVSGRITRIYTADGDKMNEIDDIVNCESRSFVIVSGDDPFYHIKYDVNAIVPSKIKGLGGSTTKNELMGLIRYPKYKPFLPPTLEERDGLESREARRNYVAPKPAKKKKKAAEAKESGKKSAKNNGKKAQTPLPPKPKTALSRALSAAKSVIEEEDSAKKGGKSDADDKYESKDLKVMKSGSAKGAKSKPTTSGWAEEEGEIQEEKIEEENSLPPLPLTGI